MKAKEQQIGKEKQELERQAVLFEHQLQAWKEADAIRENKMEEQIAVLAEQLSTEQVQANTDKKESAFTISEQKTRIAELEKERKTLRYEMDKDRTLNEEKFKFLTEQKVKAMAEQQKDARKFQEDLAEQLQRFSQLKKEQKKLIEDNK